MSEYPEHDKLNAVKDQSQAIGEFLDWLRDEKGIMLARFGEGGDLYPYPRSTQDMLAEFFDIDLAEIEKEKRDMLEKIRNAPADQVG